MIKIKQAVIVEGKYDKIKLSTVLDTVIIQTDGFGIFKDKEKQKLIKRLAQTRKTASFTPIIPTCSAKSAERTRRLKRAN